MSTVTVTHNLVHSSSCLFFLSLLRFPLDAWLASAGVLSLDELRQGLADVGITDEQIDQLSCELDTDHNGKVLLK